MIHLSVKIQKRVVAVEVEVAADVAVLDGTDAENLLVRFNAAKEAMRELEREKKAVEAEIRALMGEAKVGSIGGVDRLFFQSVTREGVDKEALAADFPEAYAAVRTETTYTVLKTK